MYDEQLKFDPEKTPLDVRPVVALAGSMEDMGIQYGQQAKELIARNAAVIKSRVYPMWESKDALHNAIKQYEGILLEKLPEMVDFCKGISQGADLDYDDVCMINLSLPLLVMAPENLKEKDEAMACSTITAYGRATKDGKTYSAANLDQGWNMGNYTVVLVGFPDKGNAFISTPPWAGEIVGNMGLNSSGLVTLGSAGQAELPTDTATGIPNLLGKFGILLHCNSVDEAVKYYVDLHCSNAENGHFSDPKKSAVVEYTPGHHVVRYAGDHGETDYTIATNHFIAEEMQTSIYKGSYNDGWYDAYPRYDTYQKLMEEYHGDITFRQIEEMITCHDYWDGKVWHRDVYSMEPFIDPESSWCPEMRAPDWKALMQAIAVPEDRVVYLRNGESDRRFSMVPEATGEFCKLVLKDNIEDVYSIAVNDAKVEIWRAARDLNIAHNTDYHKEKLLQDAKHEMWRNFNYKAIADLATGNEKMLNYGKSITALCKAQIYAKMAQIK